MGLYFIITTFLQDIFVELFAMHLKKIYQLKKFLASRTNFPITKRTTETLFEH